MLVSWLTRGKLNNFTLTKKNVKMYNKSFSLNLSSNNHGSNLLIFENCSSPWQTCTIDLDSRRYLISYS